MDSGLRWRLFRLYTTTGNLVSIGSGEIEIYRVFAEAFNLEVALGTPPSEALFFVVSGLYPYWNSKYDEETFGSWVIDNPAGTSRYVFDGRDFVLSVEKGQDRLSWHWQIQAGENVPAEFFRYLADSIYG